MADGIGAPVTPQIEASTGNESTGNEQLSQESDFITPEEAAKLSKRKIKHKIDGKDVEVTFEELQKGYAHNTAASKRMQEAANERKAIRADKQAMEAEIARLRDPKEARKILSKYLGDDGFSTLAHETVMEALRKESMSPKQLQAEADAEELRQHRNAKNKAAEDEKINSHKAAVEKFTDELTTDLSEFVQKTGGKIQPHEMESLLGLMLDAMENDVDLPLEDAWRYVQKQEAARFDRYLQNIDLSNLPKEFVEKVRKQGLSNLPSRSKQDNKPAQSAPSKKKDDTVDAGSFFQRMRK